MNVFFENGRWFVETMGGHIHDRDVDEETRVFKEKPVLIAEWYESEGVDYAEGHYEKWHNRFRAGHIEFTVTRTIWKGGAGNGWSEWHETFTDTVACPIKGYYRTKDGELYFPKVSR